jgi:hypothetical protein
MQIEEVSLDEMWKVIERFGIKREMLDGKISNQDIKDLYLLIRSKK